MSQPTLDLRDTERDEAIISLNAQGIEDSVRLFINSISPVCGAVIKNAPIDLNDDRLVITVREGGAFTINMMGVKAKLQKYACEAIGPNVYVEIRERPIDSDETAQTATEEPPAPVVRIVRKASDPKPPQIEKKVTPINKTRAKARTKVRVSGEIPGDIKPLSDDFTENEEVLIEGAVFRSDAREIKNDRMLVRFDVTDGNNSITVKFFCKPSDYPKDYRRLLEKKSRLTIAGTAKYDEYSREINVMAKELCPSKPPVRTDAAEKKRVELHLHTKMSSMDGVTEVEDYIERAALWGHKAVAITDHGVAQAFPQAMSAAQEKKIKVIYGVEGFLAADVDASKIKKQKYHHVIILARNKTGLRNMYEIISKSHIDYFHKRPLIPKSLLEEMREGLLVGSACESGELYSALREGQTEEQINSLADFYDYYEIQPLDNNFFLLRDGRVNSAEELKEINKRIVSLGERRGKPVVATCDVHFLDPADEIYRRIIMAGEGYKDADHQAPLFYRTTGEMLGEFAYLGEEKAYEVVVENTNAICDMIEEILPLPDGTYHPKIDGSDEELKRITCEEARKIYGDPLPQAVADRIGTELDSIINNGFSVLYYAANRLVKKSMSEGYLVGSRGSVGSSLVATLIGITEVNPLSPHYLCGGCRYTDFGSETVLSHAGSSGIDLPDRDCPVCGQKLSKDGHDIPFETFLGFEKNKEPDIDLNFSGEYQMNAHAHAEELFGKENVFKAGTISTIAEKTAFGFVMKYFENKGVILREAEISRLQAGLTGVRKTTGQHPGGLMLLPKGRSIYEFCPIQRPANDSASNVTTTHFNYDSIKPRLLKLDLLGHDVPTIIHMMHEATGVDPVTVPLHDKDVISLFTSPGAMGIGVDDINCQTGSLGLPEFGTQFVRQMLIETNPSTFSGLVRISGLSHGTDVWTNNSQELIRDKVATLDEIIACRDDIMTYLIRMGIEKKAAFQIMENVRTKNKNITDEDESIMEEAGIPDWYIESCKKIEYLFPKAHAVAYVTSTIRVAYFKLYHPGVFYAAIFSVKALDFDYELMCRGADIAKEEMKRINALGKAASAKDKNMQTLLELIIEMYARGLAFIKLDLYRSCAVKFISTPEGVMPSLCSLAGLGESVANGIIEARKDGEFTTVEDFSQRTRTNKTVVDLLIKNGLLNGIPETSQITLF